MDSVLFRRSLSRVPDTGFSVEPVVLAFVGNMFIEQAFISTYFAWVHPWMPFLSRKSFMEKILNPLGSAQPGNTLLIAAMKLVAITPHDSSLRSGIYSSIKANLLRAAASSLFEFRIFQAMLLLALYELGHAIYPAAYMTVGSCIHYGNALGIDMMVELKVQEAFNDVECEEKRRSWWALMLLER